MAAADLPAWASGISALAATAGTAAWLTYNERKKRKNEPTPSNDGATQVVAATFTERGLMERLISALTSVDGGVRDSTAVTTDLVKLLKAEAHRRDLEAEVRQALKDRGIIDP